MAMKHEAVQKDVMTGEQENSNLVNTTSVSGDVTEKLLDLCTLLKNTRSLPEFLLNKINSGINTLNTLTSVGSHELILQVFKMVEDANYMFLTNDILAARLDPMDLLALMPPLTSMSMKQFDITEESLKNFIDRLNEFENKTDSAHINYKPMSLTLSMDYLKNVNGNLQTIIDARDVIASMDKYTKKYMNHELTITEKDYQSIKQWTDQVIKKVHLCIDHLIKNVKIIDQALSQGIDQLPIVSNEADSMVLAKRLNDFFPDECSIYAYLAAVEETLPSKIDLFSRMKDSIAKGMLISTNNETNIMYRKDIALMCDTLQKMQDTLVRFEEKNFVFPEKWKDHMLLSKKLLNVQLSKVSDLKNQLEALLEKQDEEEKILSSVMKKLDACRANIKIHFQELKNSSRGLPVYNEFAENSGQDLHKLLSELPNLKYSDEDLSVINKIISKPKVDILVNSRLNRMNKDHEKLIQKTQLLEKEIESQHKIFLLYDKEMADFIIMCENSLLLSLHIDDKNVDFVEEKLNNDFVLRLAPLTVEEETLKKRCLSMINDYKIKSLKLRNAIHAVFGDRLQEVNGNVNVGKYILDYWDKINPPNKNELLILNEYFPVELERIKAFLVIAVEYPMVNVEFHKRSEVLINSLLKKIKDELSRM